MISYYHGIEAHKNIAMRIIFAKIAFDKGLRQIFRISVAKIIVEAPHILQENGSCYFKQDWKEFYVLLQRFQGNLLNGTEYCPFIFAALFKACEMYCIVLKV